MKAFAQGANESGRVGRGLVHFPIADDQNWAQGNSCGVALDERIWINVSGQAVPQDREVFSLRVIQERRHPPWK